MTHRLGCAVSLGPREVFTGHNFALGSISCHAEQAALEAALRTLGRLRAFRHSRKQRRFERVSSTGVDAGGCALAQ